MNQFVNKKINLSTNSKWSHVLYLNQLPELPFIKKLSGISEVVSADISSGGSIPYEYLKYIDFLFISEEDLKISFSDLCKQTKGWVILHYPSGSSSSNGKETVKVSNEVVKNLNVLGAGDIFCSNFINEMLLSNNIKKSLKYSHNATSNFLKLKNEQKI
jgi:sugar/nucleoside kinase (ribokinase family)